MFWNFNSSPQIDTVLFKEDLTLNELLDQENVLQELKSQNIKLIDFITRGDVMAQLVSLVTEEPSYDLDERERYRRPNIACEVLTTDIPKLNETLSEKTLLSKLYAFLEAEPPLNPLLASFFSRTLSMLICRKADQNWYSYQFTCLQALDFFKTRDNSLDLLLKHLGTSAIMDLTLKLITQIEGPDMQRNILDWLQNKGLVSSVISLFDPSVDADRHYNAAQLLCDTIRKCREMCGATERKKDPIFEAIQSPAMIEKLLELMLGDAHSESSIVGGISVLLTLLEPSPGCSEDPASGEPADPTSTLTTITTIVPFLPKFHNLLINPPKKDGIKLACGPVDPPLGNTRLSVIKLFAALIASNTPEVNVMFDQLNTVQVLLDLFFQYTWNNFLHTQVEKCLAFALNSCSSGSYQSNPLISSVFIKCRLLQRILEAWEENETEQCKGGKRRGYMGHLTNIANHVVKQEESCLKEFFDQNVDPDTMMSWHQFIEKFLIPINEIQQSFLGGKHPAHDTGDDDNVAFDVPFSDDPNLQQNFSQFQQKAQYNENYSFSNFKVDETTKNDAEMKVREEAFEEMCRHNMLPMEQLVFNVEQSVEDEQWFPMSDSVWNTSDDVASNSSEEDEKSNPEVTEEGFADPDLWCSVGVGTPVVDPRNPWMKSDTDLPTTPENEGWADFASNFLTDNIEQQFQAVQLSTDNSLASEAPLLEEVELDVSDNPPKVNVDAIETSEEVGEKSDNNANLNSLTREDGIPEDELIDNFRFLSKQGMIAENEEPPVAANQDVKVEEKQSEISTSESGGEAAVESEIDKKKEVPGEPV